MTNRYQELLAALPAGSYYGKEEEILPFRNTPYEFRFPTQTPNQRYGIFVNGMFRGIVDTDAQGVAVVNVELETNKNTIELINEATQAVFTAYPTVRVYAVWLAAHADALTIIDDLHQEIRDALSLETATALFIEEVYGRALMQPNDAGYITDAYRNTLIEIRQAFRLWAARPAGLRQVVHAITGVSPLRVPAAWRPKFVLDGQLLDGGGDLLNITALLNDASFPTLNARAANFVRAAIPDNVTPVPGAFRSPPSPEALSVTFDAAWVAGAGGDLIISGFDATGAQITDTFVKPAAAGTVTGTLGEIFASITAVRPSTLGAGAGTASIGLAHSRFIKLIAARGPLSLSGGPAAHTLSHVSKIGFPGIDFDLLALDGGVAVDLVADGRYRLTGNIGYFGGVGAVEARLDGIRTVTPPGATINYGTRDYLHFRIDHNVIISARLPAAPATLAAVATALNAWIARQEDLGATRATGLITIVAPGSISEGQIITVTDGDAIVAVFEADSDNTVSAGNIPFNRVGTAAQVRDALRTQLNLSGILISGQPSGAAAIALRSELGGTSSNIAITTTIPGAGATVIGMSGGTDASAAFLNRTAAVSNAIGDILQILASIGSLGPAGAVEVLPHPVDAAADILGFPRRRTTLDGAHVAGVTALDCSIAGTAQFPTFPTVVVHATLASSVVAAPGPFAALSFASPLEVWFSPEYDGGDLLLDGETSEGARVTEAIAYPGRSIVDSGAVGVGIFQTGGRAANSPGALATVLVGTADGPAAEIRVYNTLAPGAAGNAWTVDVVIPGAPDQSLTIGVAGTVITINVATNPGGLPASTGRQIADALEAAGVLATPTGSGSNVFTALTEAGSPFAFASGADDGATVHLTQVRGDIARHEFLSTVRPGMMFRVLSGALAGTIRAIVAVNIGSKSYPPDGYLTSSGRTAEFGVDTREIRLASSVGASFLNVAWEVVEPVVVKGAIVYRTLLAMSSGAAGSTGRYQLRIRDGVEDYGQPIRVGRGSRQTGTDGVILGPLAVGGATGAFQSATYAPHPDDFQGILRIRNSTAWAGGNNGLHRIYRQDPLTLGATPGSAFLEHFWWARGGRFNLRPNSTTDWSSFVADDNLSWDVYSSGEVVMLIGNDRATGFLAIAEPGLVNSKITGALVEDAGEMPVQRAGLEEGLDELEVDILRVLAPTAALTTENVTAQARIVPDGWRLYNIDEGGSRLDTWGYTNDLHLRLQSNGGTVLGGGLVIELRIPRALQYKGFTLRISFWLEQMFAAAAQNFRIDVSFNNGSSFSVGAAIAVPLSITDAGANGYGGGNPTEVFREIEVPTDAKSCIVRLRHAAVTASGAQVFIEKVIVSAQQGLFLEATTPALHETHAQFGELLYVWAPEALNDAEVRSLGLPDPETAAMTAASPGHIDRIINAHGYWERTDISEYDGSGAPINIKGIYDEAAWFAATLVNLEVVPLVPGRHSYVRPIAVSLVEGEELVISAPSNAVLAETSRHEGLFPQVAELRDRLYQDGVPVPDTAFPGTRATAAIGAYLGVNGTVLITADVAGAAGNSFTVTVDAAVGADRPLSATINPATGAVVVSLAARDGVLLTNENRALLVAEALDALEGITATYLPGTGAAALNIAQGPIAFTGAQSSPWRFLSATTVQIASIAAGDPNTVAFYPEGIHAAVGATPVFDAASIYTIDYERLTRATSAVLDLGADFANYLWLVDAAIYRRTEPEIIERMRSAPLLFRSDFTAVLPEASTQDETTSALYRDNGVVRAQIPITDWSYLDARTVQLEPAQFDADAVYTLEYTAESGRFPRVAQFVLEARSATTSPAVASADWREVEIDEIVGRPGGTPHRFHQIRVSVTNVVDVRDIRIKSLGFKGIHLYGAEARAPGILEE